MAGDAPPACKTDAVLPMLATKGDHVPTGPGWAHEVKWDGMRVLVDVRDGRARLWSRRGWPSATR